MPSRSTGRVALTAAANATRAPRTAEPYRPLRTILLPYLEISWPAVSVPSAVPSTPAAFGTPLQLAPAALFAIRVAAVLAPAIAVFVAATPANRDFIAMTLG